MFMKILIDKNVNYKKFNDFIRMNNIYCEAIGLNIETKNKKIEEKPALSNLGHSKLPMRFGSDELIKEIESIIGKQNVGDVLHVESANFENCNIFITEDRDILSKKDELYKKLPELNIMNLEEFERFIFHK